MIKHWTIQQINMKVKPIREWVTGSPHGFMTEIIAEVELDDGWGNNINIFCAWIGDIINLKEIIAEVNEAVEKVLAGQTDGVRMTKGGFEIVL